MTEQPDQAAHEAAAAARRVDDCRTSWHDEGVGHVCRKWRGHNLPHVCTVCSAVFPPAFALHADEDAQ